MTALRKQDEYKDTIVYGAFVPFMEQEENLIGFFREGEKKLLILANMQKEERMVAIPGKIEKALLNNLDTINIKGNAMLLNSYQFLILQIS